MGLFTEMSKTILVTGSRGVIGRQVAKDLTSLGHKVIGTRRPSQAESDQNEIVFQEWTELEVNRLQLDAVIHLAGIYRTSLDLDTKRECFEVNLGLTESIAALQAKTKVPVIAAGSFFEKAPGSPWSYYSISKAAGREILRISAEEANSKSAYLYLYDSYSQDQSRGKFLDLLLNSAKTSVGLKASQGDQVQDLTHVSDISSAFICALQGLTFQDNPFTEFQIRSREVVSLKELAEKVSTHLGKLPEIDWGFYPYRAREVFNIWDCAPDLIGWTPQNTLDSFLSGYKENSLA